MPRRFVSRDDSVNRLTPWSGGYRSLCRNNRQKCLKQWQLRRFWNSGGGDGFDLQGVADTRYPPWGHRCRCLVISLTEKQAVARGWNGTALPVPAKGAGDWDHSPVIGADEGLKQAIEARRRACIPGLFASGRGGKVWCDARGAAVLRAMYEKLISGGRMSAQDKADYSAWVDDIVAEKVKPQHEFRQVGNVPGFVMQNDDVLSLNPFGPDIHISDFEIRHSLRDVKRDRGASLGVETIKNLPDVLMLSKWFFDTVHRNLMAVFEVGDSVHVGKAVIEFNYTRRNVVYNAVLTTGIIQRANLEEREYMEILSDGPNP